MTLRNFGKLSAALTIAFIAITIRSELRGRHTRDYGRLLGTQLQTEVKQKPVEVVREAPPPVDDQLVADPMLVEPMVREQQFLRDEPEILTYGGSSTAAVIAPSEGRSRVSIVGGPEGVSVVQETRQRPKLRGGFGR
jgi:hypothetical protein